VDGSTICIWVHALSLTQFLLPPLFVVQYIRLKIVFGPRLGSGEFSHVYEVKSFQLQEDFSDAAANASAEELGQRIHMKKHEMYRETKNARYALKHIQDEHHLHHGAESYVQAAG
jgi:hypothetical protein